MLLIVLACVISCGHIKPINEGKAAENTTAVNVNDRQAYQEIFRAIDRYGQARVIIELKIDHAGELTPSIINTAQDKLLQQLTGYHSKLVRRYSSLPMLTLEVDKESLEFLIRSPLVKSIHFDSRRHSMDSQ